MADVLELGQGTHCGVIRLAAWRSHLRPSQNHRVGSVGNWSMKCPDERASGQQKPQWTLWFYFQKQEGCRDWRRCMPTNCSVFIEYIIYQYWFCFFFFFVSCWWVMGRSPSLPASRPDNRQKARGIGSLWEVDGGSIKLQESLTHQAGSQLSPCANPFKSISPCMKRVFHSPLNRSMSSHGLHLGQQTSINIYLFR